MLRKALAFLLLISHMNTSMFLPQVTEQDAFDRSGRPFNDINSLVEFVNEVILNHHQSPPIDEDDDNGQNFHMVKMVDYSYQPFLSEIQEKITVREEPNPPFPVYHEKETAPGYSSILLPPPKS
jgi:hypothetical protein